MANPLYSNELQTVYEVEPAALEHYQKHAEKLHAVWITHKHRVVRVQTVHGHCFEGYIVHIDSTHLYLQTTQPAARAFGAFGGVPFNPYYNNVVLPLVLFNLLAISLI